MWRLNWTYKYYSGQIPDINQTHRGASPLHVAKINGHAELTTLLAENGGLDISETVSDRVDFHQVFSSQDIYNALENRDFNLVKYLAEMDILSEEEKNEIFTHILHLNLSIVEKFEVIRAISLNTKSFHVSTNVKLAHFRRQQFELRM